MKRITVTEKILKKPVTVFMMSLLVVGFGLFSLTNLRVTLMPEFNIPIIAVSVSYPNIAPQDMSRLVVEPIEGAIMGVDGIDEVESNVRRGNAFIILSLKPGTNVDNTEMKVREAIQRIRPSLPMEASEPTVFQFDPESAPIMQLSLESAELGLDDLRVFSEERLEPRFERIHGVASADTEGGLRPSFYISLDPVSMSRHQVMPSDVTRAIRDNNAIQPIGNLVSSGVSYSIRAQSYYQSMDEIEHTVIRLTDDGVPVRVSDVASVENTYAEVTAIEEVNGKNSVTIQIMKQSDANTLDVTHAVLREMEEMAGILPPSVTMQVLSNEGDFIENSINNLAQSAVIALCVVIGILLLFMGGWRIAFVVAMSIPVSLTATFAAMYFFDVTLNIISITGLALAIGLLVDNSIVVTESIAKKLEAGIKRRKAVIEGTNEVAGALLGSTLTTLAVFVPIMLVSGMTGTFTRDLAITISFAITSSFLASIILIPVLASLLLRRSQFTNRNLMFWLIAYAEKNYGRILFWLLHRKYLVGIFVILVVSGAFYIFKNIPGEFFPETDTGEFDIQVELPAGTPLTVTATTMREIAEKILEAPEVRTVITSIGRRRWSAQSNAGQMTVLLVDHRERRKSADDMIQQFREQFDDPDIELDFRVSGSGPGGMRGGRWGSRGVQVTLFGSEVEVLRDLSYRIEERLQKEPWVVSVFNPRTRPGPELQFHPDRERIARINVGTQEVASELGAQARGSRAGYFRQEGREVPIEIRNDRTWFQSREDLFSMELLQLEDVRMPVLALGSFELTESFQSITRRDREIILDVNVMVQGNEDQLRGSIDRILSEEFQFPDGYRYDFSGRVRLQDDSARELGIAFIFALLLTYMVMASLFENFRDPFIIMFAVPLAFFGSLVFLFITQTPLSVPAYIGIVILVGIVVNNGIVLVDYIHQKTKGGLNADLAEAGELDQRAYITAFLEACKRRMRPILLTAMTTIFSMIPLALEFGAGSETWSPLARSVIGGLAFATLLTLFVVPSVVIAISRKRRSIFKKKNISAADSS
ncbi:efflux RND transporter permease subunit [Balneolaceae bacterium ANBcel3]|nr:efflux RND transporter permease subunit [Balneolaceae bacterium ANBcel3]